MIPRDQRIQDHGDQVQDQGFTVKDSGKRMEFESGMVRDTNDNKTFWHLIADGPMFRRWAEHLTKGAVKYKARNWMKASGEAEAERFKESAFRHFMQWYYGDRDEDHASAVFFNINGFEYVTEKTKPVFHGIDFGITTYGAGGNGGKANK